MLFLTQGKNNWKLIGVAGSLAVVLIFFGIKWYCQNYKMSGSEPPSYLSLGCGQKCIYCCYIYTYEDIENNKFIGLERVALYASKETLDECIYSKGHRDKKQLTFREKEIIKACIREKETDSNRLDELITDFFCDDLVLPEWGKLIGADYMIQEVDLNDDGVNETIVGGEHCSYEQKDHFIISDMGNAPHLILQEKDKIWSKMGDFNGRFSFIGEEKNNEYYDIIVEIKMGPDYYATESYRWQDDKLKYKPIESNE